MSHSPSNTPPDGRNPTDLRDEEDFEMLLGNAGSKPSLEERHVAQITEAARAEFRRSFGSKENSEPVLDFVPATETQPPSTRPSSTQASSTQPSRLPRLAMALAASLAAIALAALLSRSFLADAPQIVATVVALQGEAASPTEPRELFEVGQTVLEGARLATSENGSLAIVLTTGHSVRLAAGTQIQLVGPGQIELSQGAVYVDSGSSERSEQNSGAKAASGSVEVRTNWGTAIDIGTQFEVRIVDRGRMRVRVREGLVELTHRDGQQRTASAGTSLELDESGTFEESTISAADESWRWILALATAPFETDPSAQQLLDWVSRETGWPVRYESQAARDLAAETIRGVPLDIRPLGEALQLLPTGGLTAREEDGELVVRKAP